MEKNGHDYRLFAKENEINNLYLEQIQFFEKWVTDLETNLSKLNQDQVLENVDNKLQAKAKLMIEQEIEENLFYLLKFIKDEILGRFWKHHLIISKFKVKYILRLNYLVKQYSHLAKKYSFNQDIFFNLYSLQNRINTLKSKNSA